MHYWFFSPVAMWMSFNNRRCRLWAGVPAPASNSPDSSHPSSRSPASSSFPTQITRCNLHAPSRCRRLMTASNTHKAIPEPEERLYCIVCSSVFDCALTQSSPSQSLCIWVVGRTFTTLVEFLHTVCGAETPERAKLPAVQGSTSSHHLQHAGPPLHRWLTGVKLTNSLIYGGWGWGGSSPSPLLNCMK